MEIVALTLQKAAIERRNVPEEFDQFGRSAFNRYYYATFLEVRSCILNFEPTWAGAHASIPEMLTGSIAREIKKRRNKAVRHNDQETVEICNKAISATSALSSMMKSANTVRVTADYNPSIKVSRDDNDRFSLGTVSITDAHSWREKAKSLSSAISRGWRLARD